MCAHSVATNTSCASVQFWPVAHHVEKQENSYLLHACKNYCWLGFVVVAAVLFGVFFPRFTAVWRCAICGMLLLLPQKCFLVKIYKIQ